MPPIPIHADYREGKTAVVELLRVSRVRPPEARRLACPASAEAIREHKSDSEGRPPASLKLVALAALFPTPA